MKTTSKQILEKISRSSTFREYEKAFRDSTQLPLTLTPIETWGLPQHGRPNENPFCAMIAGDRRACAACLSAQKQLCGSPMNGTSTVTCFAGFSESAVPLRVNGAPIGLLQTGQVLLKPPTREQFNKVKERLDEMGSSIDEEGLEESYFKTIVLDPERYQATVALLKHFASHLELVANRILMENENTEAPIIQRARAFIDQNYAENISLGDAAAAVHASTFYFCKVFRKGTGLTFTEYLTRVRIEKAKTDLGNPHLRISEVAFAVGFQSLSQFNRAFKSVVGKSPTEYRNKLSRVLVA
jgi:AraC-like DNA-binding protein